MGRYERAYRRRVKQGEAIFYFLAKIVLRLCFVLACIFALLLTISVFYQAVLIPFRWLGLVD